MQVVTRVLWQSRENKARKCRNLRQQLDEAKRAIAQQDAEIQQQKEEIRAFRPTRTAWKT